ncbi:MAG: hypothetical protein LT071_11235, partial [Nocardioides sp.]|nr:hypothetical protein [Nocardioides sp.]
RCGKRLTWRTRATPTAACATIQRTALTVVAFLAARVRQDVRPTALAVVGTVAAASFVATSLFALTGVLLSDPAMSIGALLEVVLVAVAWDVLLTPLVLPPLMKLFGRLDPQWAAP